MSGHLVRNLSEPVRCASRTDNTPLIGVSVRVSEGRPATTVGARLLDLHEEGGVLLEVSYWTVRDLVLQAGKLPSVKLPNARRKGESV